MAIAQKSDVGPSAESLSLSASVFTSQISSWIPADFGQNCKPSTSSSNAAPAPIDSIFLTEHDRGERLGLGHPLLEVPKHQRKQDTSSSLSSLGRKLGMNGKGKGKEAEDGGFGTKASNGGEGSSDDDGEEESRASIGKKRKVDRVDIWGGKKKNKAKPSIAADSKSTQTSVSVLETDTPAKEAEIQAPRLKSDSPTSPISSGNPPSSAPSGPSGLNKNQRKKLRKKQKKLAESAG